MKSKFKYIRVKDVCNYLDIDENTVYRKLNRKDLPGAVKFGKIWLIDRETFEQYLENGGDVL